MKKSAVSRRHHPHVLRHGKPFATSIERAAEKNTYFRRVLYTGPQLQLVLMSLRPGEEIGMEVHRHTDQFFRIEKGLAMLVTGRGRGEERVVGAGDAIVVPAGTFHNAINLSSTKPLKLYTVYAPPQHPPGTIHKTKAAAERAERRSHG